MTRAGARTRGQTVIATAAVAGLELAWLYALLHTLSQGMKVAVSVSSLLLIYAASFALTLGLRATGRSSRTTKVLSWVVWPLATLVLLMVLLYPNGSLTDGSWTAAMLQALSGILDDIEAAMFIVPAAGVLWSLGARLASSRMAYETVVTEFQLGLMALAGSLFIGYLVGVDQPAAVPIAVAFVGLGLVGAAATRVADEGGPLFFQQGGTWWGMLLVSVALVLALGLLAGVLFTPELMQFVARGIRAVWELIERLLDALAGLFSSSGSEMEPPPVAEVPLPQDDGQSFSWGLPEWLLRPSRIAYGVLVGGLMLVAIWRIASQLFDWILRRAGRGRVEMESLPGAFRLDLARLFRRMLAWVCSLSPFARFRRRPQEESTLTTSIRRLYADMLRWGARSGFPRGSSQTPYEYQQVLCMALPAHRTDVAFITESYVRAKYAGQPPTEAELHQLKESRRRLKRRAARAVPAVDSRPSSRPADKTEGHGDTHRRAF